MKLEWKFNPRNGQYWCGDETQQQEFKVRHGYYTRIPNRDIFVHEDEGVWYGFFIYKDAPRLGPFDSKDEAIKVMEDVAAFRNVERQ